MACAHKRDSFWQTDLIWHYFHEVRTPARPWGDWHKKMDPREELTDRHHVYELLVDNPDQTNPSGDDMVGKSLIPWNQNNAEFLQCVQGQLWCGSIVKIVFARYMGWNGVEPNSHSVNQKVFNAADWTIDQLRHNKPVRAFVAGHHYVGIVGHRCQLKPLPAGVAGPLACSNDNDFLYIDPWAGGISGQTSITYAGTTTCFLGIIKQHGSTWTYDTELVTAVEGQ